MKVIDLLNKIAKGEAPETIFYMRATYDYDKECMDYEDVDTGDLFFDDRYNTQILNDEVEIIEEDTFEDIEETDVALLGQCNNWLRNPMSDETRKDIELNPYIISNIRENTLEFQHKINALIRNQKKIISKLEDN